MAGIDRAIVEAGVPADNIRPGFGTELEEIDRLGDRWDMSQRFGKRDAGHA